MLNIVMATFKFVSKIRCNWQAWVDFFVQAANFVSRTDLTSNYIVISKKATKFLMGIMWKQNIFSQLQNFKNNSQTLVNLTTFFVNTSTIWKLQFLRINKIAFILSIKKISSHDLYCKSTFNKFRTLIG